MPLDEDLKGTASSDVSDLDGQQAADAQAASVAAADDATSSAATGEDKEVGLLDVVRDVVDKSRPKPEAASPAEGEEDGAEETDKPKQPDNEDFADVPFRKHPRFRELIQERNLLRPDAVRYRNVQTFLDDNGLTADEAGDMLVVGALAKTNPAEAWQRVKPWVQKLLVAAGEVLPENLSSRVQAGEISHEAAMEISRANATATSVQASQTFREQQEARRQQTEHGQSIVNAAQGWESDRRLKDPNFDAKLEPLTKEIAYLQVKEGKPKTPEGVKDQLQRAYKAVNASFAPPAPPKPTPRPVVPIRGGQVAGNQQPSQGSTLDIVRANRRAG